VLTGQIGVAALRKILISIVTQLNGISAERIARSAESICCEATRNKCYPRA